MIDAHRRLPSLSALGIGGVRHERLVRGADPTRAGEIFPWSHKIFGNLKTWLRGTFHGASAQAPAALPR